MRMHAKPGGIQPIMLITFTGLSVIIVVLLTIVFLVGFHSASEETSMANSQVILEQTGNRLESFLVTMRHISDTAAYDILSENDYSNPDIDREMYLLYEANQNSVRSIALYNSAGSLLMGEPMANQKEDPNVTKQSWFKGAFKEVENLYFSTPHIQNLFEDEAGKYHWVISMSRTVDLTSKGSQMTGVLLVDMNYSDIERMMEQINGERNGQYYYLCDYDGHLIFHPYQASIDMGEQSEGTLKTVRNMDDGVKSVWIDGKLVHLAVRTIAYTGWKAVAVIPDSSLTQNMVNNFWFILFFITLILMLVLIVNRLAAIRISQPVLELNNSVKNVEADLGSKVQIYIGGPSEVRHLGSSIQKSYDEIERLMKEIVREERQRRKSEMDALQSQINPHFLYNTLDSITWMIEGGKNEDASYMITQLARLFRISLSKGRTIIPIGDELKHAESYMNLQKYRYKDRFTVTYDVPDDLKNYCIVKLVLQPILENSIYYGVDGLDDDGEIVVKAEKKDDGIFISVTDNGMGMDEETLDSLLTDENRVHKHGSGVGLLNVHNRIQLMFGDEYGLTIESEPDEGTCVTIHIPAIGYNEENRKELESGRNYG